MNKGTKGALKNVLIVVLAVGVLIPVGFLAYNYFNTQSSQTVGTFSIRVQDGLAGKSLPLSDFNYTLYGLPVGESASDPIAWEEIEDGETLEGITAGDLDTGDYSAFYVEFNGLVEQDAAAFDDALGTRVYPTRQASIMPGQVNTLIVYAAPSTVVLEIRNAVSLALITNVTATPIAGQTNVTMLIMCSASYPDSAYEAYWSFSANDWVYPQLLLQYNDTVTTSTALQISGASMTRVDATHMAYRFSSLSGITSLSAKWPPSAETTLGINDAEVLFDGAVLASNP
jgi:hypothetical protein